MVSALLYEGADPEAVRLPVPLPATLTITITIILPITLTPIWMCADPDPGQDPNT